MKKVSWTLFSKELWILLTETGFDLGMRMKQMWYQVHLKYATLCKTYKVQNKNAQIEGKTKAGTNPQRGPNITLVLKAQEKQQTGELSIFLAVCYMFAKAAACVFTL